jgi:hypothetical protein
MTSATSPTTQPPQLDPALDPGSGAQKRLTNDCTISCTIPDSGGWPRNHWQFLQTQCEEMSAERQWKMSRFLTNPRWWRTKKPLPLDRDVLRKCRSYVYLTSAVRWPRG